MKKVLSLLAVFLMIFVILSVALPVEAATKITSISITGIETPIAGKAPDYTGTVGASSYKIDYIDWYDKTAGRFMKPENGDKFEVGHVYQLQVYIDAKSGYEFATQSQMPAITATLNGNSVTAKKTDGTVAWATVVIFKEYTAVGIVNNVAISGIDTPALGKIPDCTGTVGASSYEIDYIDWYDKTAGRFMKPENGDKFEAGHVYQLQVYVDVKSGYEFATQNQMPAITATINGKSVTAKKTDGTVAWAKVVMYYEYSFEQYLIKDIAISDISVPAIGKTPDYTGIVGASSYEIDYIDWYDKTSGKFLKSENGDKFEAGHTYQLQVYIDAKGGYKFATKNSMPELTATLNGVKVTAKKTDGTVAWATVVIYYEYELDANKILEVEVSDIENPAVGKAPDYTGKVGASTYEIDYIDWYDKTAGRFMKPENGDKFEDGHTYQLQVYLDANKGSEFATKNSMPALTAKLNGINVTAKKTDGTVAWAKVAIYYEYTLNNKTNEPSVTPDNNSTPAPTPASTPESNSESTPAPTPADATEIPSDEPGATEKVKETAAPSSVKSPEKGTPDNDDEGSNLWIIFVIIGVVAVAAAVVVVLVIKKKK